MTPSQTSGVPLRAIPPPQNETPSEAGKQPRAQNKDAANGTMGHVDAIVNGRAAGFMAAHGATLLERGYLPIPIARGEKRPSVSGWQKLRMTPGDVQKHGADSVGILTGQGANPLAGVDLDIKHSGLAAALMSYCWNHLPETVERIGDAPKTLFVFRATRAGMQKRTSAAFIDPANPTLLQRVEVLGAGQQFVAYGMHPGTGRPYKWTDDRGGLDAVDAHSLPVITEGHVAALFAEFERKALALGLQRHAPDAKQATTTPSAGDPLDVSIYAAQRAQLVAAVTDTTIADLRAALKHVDADNHDTWVRMGQALVGLADTGRELWFEYSERGTTFDGRKDPATTWGTFTGERTDFRAVFAEAQRRGWINQGKGDGGGGYTTRVDRTDVGNANLLARLTAGDLRYIPDRDAFLWWDGSQWAVDEHKTIAQREALRVAEHYDGEAADLEKRAEDASLEPEDRKRLKATAKSIRQWEKQCRSKRTIDAVLAVAGRMQAVQLPAAMLDCDPWLLGVENGVVDLRTGALRPAGRDDYVTKRCTAVFVPRAPAPRFQRFVEEITASPLPVTYDAGGRVDRASVGRGTARPALARYLQKMLGYALTGETREQKMFLAIGAGANGKNVLLDTVQRVAGPHFITLKPEALMSTRYEADPERPTPVARSLMGVRAAISSESREGQKLDIALVKRHTGDATMQARGLNEKAIQFQITHKLILLTNHKPALDHLDAAIRGRLHLIPFDMRWNRPGVSEHNPELPDGDAGLMASLKSEAEGILAWLIEGAALYHAEGLNPPAEVAAMTRTYFEEQDSLGRWIEEHERCDPRDGTKASELFDSFTQWCVEQGEPNRWATQKAFSGALQTHRVRSDRIKQGVRYGLRVVAVVQGAGL